nr:MAG TPA: hypothetical protein [Caudoviricetes sp.]
MLLTLHMFSAIMILANNKSKSNYRRIFSSKDNS